MERKFLFENESVLLRSNNNSISLTDKRIQCREESLGKSHLTSIFLENISSIDIYYKSMPWLLILGALLTMFALALALINNKVELLGSVIPGIICILLYYVTRRHLIVIASNGGSRMNIQTKRMDTEGVQDFVHKIELAKNQLMYPAILSI